MPNGQSSKLSKFIKANTENSKQLISGIRASKKTKSSERAMTASGTTPVRKRRKKVAEKNLRTADRNLTAKDRQELSDRRAGSGGAFRL